jgi:hypothetical protein
MAPLSKTSRCLAACAAFLLSGCAVTTHHYVLNARGEAVAPPVIPALNTADKDGHASLGVRLGRRSEPEAILQARFDGDTLHSLPFGDIDVYHTYPGNYVLDLGEVDVGLDLRILINRHVDLFLSANLRPDAFGEYYSGLLGFGVTFTMPWVHFRIAPALGAQEYSMAVTDSLTKHWGQTTDDYDTTYVRSVRERRSDNFSAFSFSIWLPENLVGPLKPYLQYQSQKISLQSRLLAQDALTVDGSTWIAGVNYALTPAWAINVAASRENFSNDLSRDALFKIETGLEFKFGAE